MPRMADSPYREVGAAPDPVVDDAGPSMADLGSLQSTHASPSLVKAVFGPIALSTLATAFAFWIAEVPTALALVFGVASLAGLAWTPIRTHGVTIELYARGLLFARRRARVILPFEEVNETWFSFEPLQFRDGARLRSIRLVDFGGRAHRIPLALVNGTSLASGILRGSALLRRDAMRALDSGQTLRRP